MQQTTPSDRLMWLSADRVLYAGLLGATTVRVLGAYTLYVSLDQPSRACLDGQDWQSGELIMVPPYVPHRIVGGGRLILKAMVEAETPDPRRLPGFLRGPGGVVHAPALAQRVRDAYARLLHAGRAVDLAGLDFDRDLLGEPLAPRQMDPRIAAALAEIKAKPSDCGDAEELAARANLSFSRFLHLFRQETGASLRNLRAWKRARSLLHYVDQESNLTEVALDAGYPDSTHFSHSIRRYYGLKPRDIFAGSRRLTVYRPADPGLPGARIC